MQWILGKSGISLAKKEFGEQLLLPGLILHCKKCSRPYCKAQKLGLKNALPILDFHSDLTDPCPTSLSSAVSQPPHHQPVVNPFFAGTSELTCGFWTASLCSSPSRFPVRWRLKWRVPENRWEAVITCYWYTELLQPHACQCAQPHSLFFLCSPARARSSASFDKKESESFLGAFI